MPFEPTPIDATPPGFPQPAPVRYVPEARLRVWKRVAIALAIACGILLLLLATTATALDGRRGLPSRAGERSHQVTGRAG
jgi:hypothetical protein